MARAARTFLSQSFFIDDPVCVTKVDLFFESCDDTIPFKVNIRQNDEGRPKGGALNFSEVVVPASAVIPNLSSNANVATTVNFDAPVYLEKGEYSLNLGSDSRAYRAYTSELNSKDLVTDRRIAEQPMLGVLSKTENMAKFIGSEFEDLKFNLYRAKFYTNVTSSVSLFPKNGTAGEDRLDTNPYEIFHDKELMKVYHFNHGFVEGSNVVLQNVGNAITAGLEGNLFGLAGNIFEQDSSNVSLAKEFVVSNVKLDSYTVHLGEGQRAANVGGNASGLLRERFGGADTYASKDYCFTTLVPFITEYNVANASAIHRVRTVKPASTGYTIDTDFQIVSNLVENKFEEKRAIPSYENFSKAQDAGDIATTEQHSFPYNIQMFTNNDKVSPLIDSQMMSVFLKRNLADNTTYTATVKDHEKTTLSNVGETSTPATNAGNGVKAMVVQLQGNVGVFTFANVADKNNCNVLVNGSILSVSANTSQTNGAGANNSGLYRVVDVQFTNANANVIVSKLSGNIDTDENNSNVYSIITSNDYITEEAATGGTTYSKYITRKLTFNNPSTSLKFFLNCSVPLNTSLDFYYRSKVAGDNTKLNDVEYRKIDMTNVIPNSLNGEFVSVEQLVTGIPEFNVLQLKIVFNSDNESAVPIIKNLRLLALA